MTIKLQGCYKIVRKRGAGIDGLVMDALTLSEASDKANEDWMKYCDDNLLRYNVLSFKSVGNYHIADTGEGCSYHIIHIPAS